jgi:transposase
MNDKQLYAQILGISVPWSVDSVDLSLEANKVTVRLSFNPQHSFACPTCGELCPRHDKKPRKWRHLDTCQLETIIECDVPRIRCEHHGVKLVHVPWAEPGSRLTLLFEAIVIKWLEVAPISAVAERLGIDWDTALRIQRQAVERGLKLRGPVSPKNITIDETSEKKGHNYLTVVSEADRVIHVETGRDKSSIDAFWKSLSSGAIAGVESISMDLWMAFRTSTMEYVPDAASKICLDRFHVAGYFGKALNDVRKREHRELSAQGDNTLKGTKFDWLRTSATIDNRSRRSFMEITQSALKTARAWGLKEIAHSLWKFVYVGVAEREWGRLISRMARSRLKPMVQLAKSLREHLWMIINAIKLNANSGNAEGNNSRIQKVKRMACGFRNTENFKIAIYFHLGGLDMRSAKLPTR